MKKIVKFTVILIVILSIATNVLASNTNAFNIELETNGTTISKEQEEVIIYLILDKYEGDGMLGYEADLEYDKNIFESATITALNDWDKVVYDATTGKFISTSTNAKVNTKIAQITLKLKTNITAQTTQVKINNFVLSDGNDENTFNEIVLYNFEYNKEQENNKQDVIDEEVKDNIDKEPTVPDVIVDTTPIKEPAKQLTVEAVDRDVIDDTKAKTNIPQTGTTTVGTTITLIVIALAIISYIKYRSIPLK